MMQSTWAKPIADEMDKSASELLCFVRDQPPEFWEGPSRLQGWTRKDVLAHLAGDTGKVASHALRAAVHGEAWTHPPDFRDGGDAANAQDVSERSGRTMEQLIAEIEQDRREWQDLLSRVRDGDEDARWEGFPLSLGQYLRICQSHDREHLAHMMSEPEERAHQ